MAKRWDEIKRHHVKFDTIGLVVEERSRQEQLKQEGRFAYTCADTDVSDTEKLVILAREFGEVAESVNVSGDKREKLLSLQTRSHLREELIQVAAVAVAWVESLVEEE